MKREVQLFSNSKKSFTFCDFDWKPPTNQQNNSGTSSQNDIYFRKYTTIYIWECGLHSGQKIIDSYLLHGEEFTEHITFRDSSFILYDSLKNRIIAVRDFMGNYTLYYHKHPEQEGFIFSFSMNALMLAKLFIPTINYAKIVEYVACELHTRPNNQTFYQHVYRLLPAYVLRIEQSFVKEFKRYGKFDFIKYQSFTDAEFIERFRELFIKSVKKNTDPFKKIAATLSGGLDSSSVCSVAQSLRESPIHTFNFTTDTAEAQENEYLEDVVNQWHTIHQTVMPGYSGYETIKKIIEQNGQPHFVFNYTIQLDLIKAAQQNNCDVFLSGHWGDQVVNYGVQYIEELANKQDWRNVKIAIDQYFQYSLASSEPDKKNSIENQSRSAKLYAIRLLLGKVKRQKQWITLPRTLWILSMYFNCHIGDLYAVIQQNVKSKKQLTRPKVDRIIRPEILAESNRIRNEHPFEVLDILDTVNAPIGFTQKRHLDVIFKGNQIYGQEEYFEIYRQNSLRSAQPFFDADLLELSLSVPLRIKFDEGRKRGTLRKALNDYLPEKVVNRTSKANFTAYYVKLFKTLCVDFNAHTPDNHAVWQLVDKQAFEENVNIVLNEREHADSKHVVMPTLIRVINLALWLDYVDQLKK